MVLTKLVVQLPPNDLLLKSHLSLACWAKKQTNCARLVFVAGITKMLGESCKLFLRFKQILSLRVASDEWLGLSANGKLNSLCMIDFLSLLLPFYFGAHKASLSMERILGLGTRLSRWEASRFRKIGPYCIFWQHFFC